MKYASYIALNHLAMVLEYSIPLYMLFRRAYRRRELCVLAVNPDNNYKSDSPPTFSFFRTARSLSQTQIIHSYPTITRQYDSKCVWSRAKRNSNSKRILRKSAKRMEINKNEKRNVRILLMKNLLFLKTWPCFLCLIWLFSAHFSSKKEPLTLLRLHVLLFSFLTAAFLLARSSKKDGPLSLLYLFSRPTSSFTHLFVFNISFQPSSSPYFSCDDVVYTPSNW